MKIAIIGPIYPYRGGIAQYTARLAKALADKFEVSVFSFSRQYPTWLYPGKSDKDPSQQPTLPNNEYTIDSLNPLSWRQTAKRIQDFQPNLMIIEWWVTFLAPAFATIAFLCRKQDIPVTFLIHNVLPHENSWLHKPLAWIALRQGNHFIVHTTKEKERLMEIIPNAKTEVCPFPIYDMLAEPGSLTKVEARKQLDLPENGPILLFFGIVRAYKGLVYLLEALSLLRDTIPELTLVVAGEFWEDKDSYLQKMENLGIRGQVRLDDYYIPDEKLSPFFLAADLVVAPYIGGTQSAVSALAIGFRIPLIATEWSAAGIDADFRHLVRVVPAGDAKSLAEAIQLSLVDPPHLESKESRKDLSGWEKLVINIEKIVRKYS